MKWLLAITLVCAVAMAEEIFAVQLQDGQNADEVAHNNGFENLGQIGSLQNFYRFRPVNGGPHATRSVQDRTLSLRANPAVVDVEKQQAKQRVHREEPESRGGRVDTGEYQ